VRSVAAKRVEGYRCSSCGAPAAKWVGRCPACEGWGTLEAVAAGTGRGVVVPLGGAARPIAGTDATQGATRPTGMAELDRVLGGGIVPGSVTLIGGEPGIGKSTLLLQAAASAARNGDRVLYVSGEESASQVRARAERLDALEEDLWLATEREVEAVVAHLDAVAPALVVVDSIQTIRAVEGSGPPGSVTQVREAAVRLVAEAKARDVAVVLVGHVTKDGSLAGPRQLEHLVDTVLSFEGDRHHALRLLRPVKHRYGTTAELGLFEMTGSGLAEVDDATGLFLADRRAGVPGSVVLPLLEGRRPLLVEIQALVVPSRAPAPRRSAEGVDAGRLALLLAVLHRRLGVPVLEAEVYALAVGGVQVSQPAADLAVVLAVASAATNVALPADVVAFGEIGLGGEVRGVRDASRRLAEARRAGFRRAVTAASTPTDGVGDIEVVRVPTVAAALAVLDLLDGPPGR